MGELGVDALLLSHGADLPWLTGYRAMPLERLTLLVLPREGEAVLVGPGARGPPGSRHRWADHAATVGRDRGPRGHGGRTAGAGTRCHLRDLGPCLGAVAAGTAVDPARRTLEGGLGGHLAAARREGRRRDRRRCAPRPTPPTVWRRCCRRARSPSPAVARSRCRRPSAPGCWRRGTAASTSPSWAAAPTGPARTTTPASG